MQQVSFTFLVLLTFSLPAQAHFIWIVPSTGETGGHGARIVFSEGPEPDRAELLKRITQTRVFAHSKGGKPQKVTYRLKGDAFTLSVPGKAAHVLEASCIYGVLARRGVDPFLLRYYAKSAVGKGGTALLQTRAAKLDLDIVLPEKAGGKAQVLWKGKPAAGAEVTIDPPGVRKSKVTTDARGFFSLPAGAKKGLYAIRARHISRETGKKDGGTYKQARNYCTLTFMK